MKKMIAVLSAVFMLFAGGCSALDQAQDTIGYVNEATDYLSKATEFANEAPALAEEAVKNMGSAEELEARLQEMKEEIAAFSELQEPEFASEIHQAILEQNEKISAGIDGLLTELEDGLLDPAVLEKTELFQTVQEMGDLADQLKQLGE
ncbi:DUF6376 family protein [Mesobacillus foraminis]|nr:DUF6376 family protein [Mesobacillus foraminis]